ncbi:MAG: hypothetical protein IJ756_09745 [Paludibacteraceae bacterium]|nr:hypothetical protein [Paludibacteraceae bacterium]
MKKNIFILSVAILALVGCKPKDIKPEDVFKSESDVIAMIEEQDGKDYIIYDAAHGGLNQFVKDYSSEKGNYMSDKSLYRKRANGSGHISPNEYLDTVYVFAIDTLPKEGKGIYIRGRVSTDDFGGNFYKALVIQQIVDGKQQNLRLSVDAGSVSGLYNLGQEILIRVNGLALGRYANQPQLCVPSYNNNTYASHADEKVGWAPGRIPIGRFNKATTLVGQPDPSKLMYQKVNIADFISNLNVVEAREMDGMLVEIDNIHFTMERSDYGSLAYCTKGNPEEDGNSCVFGPTTGNVGYPQSRVIADANGKYTLVSTSEYAKYAHMILPEAEYVGSVRGILSFYHDNNMVKEYNGADSNAPMWDDWSVSLRNLADLTLKSPDKGLWEPIEWTEENIQNIVVPSAFDKIDRENAISCAQAKEVMETEEGKGVTVVGYAVSSGNNWELSKGQQRISLADEPGGTGAFDAYWCYVDENNPIQQGDKVYVYGDVIAYNGKPEIKNGYMVKETAE